ncbi:uncharacterized protein LOC126787698 [Argentina anserina]|uniref:uncharacterized protein LOC126787698 n=1 Tax=Argentina anserina TaxID=57926 RepID=UPI0021763883|nr:uncharacterized protein LOC126787698 [Potentilla anserina]XP_050369553.1 uncharacterized protein LOC126787698 [Potentilla anserina]
MMRRQYAVDSGGANYGGAAAPASVHHHHHHHHLQQRMDQQQQPSSGGGGASDFEGRLEAFTPERDSNPNPIPYGASKPEAQWRWERDASKPSNPLTPHLFNEGQVGDTPRSYFQGQRANPKHSLETQSNSDSRSQPHIEDVDLGYEDNPSLQSFDDLEQKFRDDIRKLTNEHNDAEDAENARHKEKIGTINTQYEEQLASLRSRHAGHRDELLRRESNARQHQYQQAVMDRYPKSSMGSSDIHGYSGNPASATAGDARRSYETDQYDSYRERARFLGGSRDPGFKPRGPYPGGRVYDTGSRFY